MKSAFKVFSFDGVIPVVDPSAFVHPSAVLIGDVVVGPRCYVGPLASLRGDFGPIVMQAGSNLQDSCVMHSFPGVAALIEEDGHVGHGAILHGCRVGRNALVGMNAVLMDKVYVGENSFVAAGAFVKAGTQVPANSLVAGMPSKLIRTLTEEEIAWKTNSTRTYQMLAERSRHSLHECEPLSEMPADRKSVDWPGSYPFVSDVQVSKRDE
jgi:phenylacetic acid degradation protein